MKRILSAFVLIVIISYFSSCEKDDICVEGDTPLLIIGFFDASSEDTTVSKVVSDLLIVETILNSTVTAIADTDSIAIPLRTDEASTEFVFVENAAVDSETLELTGEIDSLRFNYIVDGEFISRACGFIANYTELDTARTVFSSDWIKRISIVNPDVKRSNAIHVKIFH